MRHASGGTLFGDAGHREQSTGIEALGSAERLGASEVTFRSADRTAARRERWSPACRGTGLCRKLGKMEKRTANAWSCAAVDGSN